jgi:DNA-binding transcriptional LysR family regulator
MEMARIALGPAELETFLAIAELGSFSRAAERLSLSQPSISNRILRLEKLLGTRLFERTTRAVLLTPAGNRLKSRVAPVIDELRSALEEFQREAESRRRAVTIAASPIVAAVLIPPTLQKFQQCYPDTQVILRDDVPFERLATLVAEIKSGAIDIAVTALATHHPDVTFAPLLEDTCVVVGSRASILQGRGEISLEDLAQEPFITLSSYMPGVALFAAELEAKGIAFRPTFQVANVTTLLGLVETGMGLALLPRFALRSNDAVEAGRLVTANLVGASLVRRIGMLHLPTSELAPSVRALSRAFQTEAARTDAFGYPPCARRDAPVHAAINR